MGFVSHKVKRSDLEAGDHIYTWRAAFTYSHHGIYIGEDKVVHFTQILNPNSANSNFWSRNWSSSANSSCTPQNWSCSAPQNWSSSVNSSGTPQNWCSSANSSSTPHTWSCSANSSSTCFLSHNWSSSANSGCMSLLDSPIFCGFRKPESGVTLSCLNCFIGNGSLYRYEYGVGLYAFIAKIRGGTCTTAKSDDPEAVIHRALYLLYNGFGQYVLLTHNCEDFALYCKTGLLPSNLRGVGGSGQASSAIFIPGVSIGSLALKLFYSTNPLTFGTVTALSYARAKYESDIGVRSDVVKVEVKDVPAFLQSKFN